jgi:NADPH-dependent curcumin reductase CurA
MRGTRRWTLARYPEGKLAESDFALAADAGETPLLQLGEVLVRNHMFAVAPTIRNWLRPGSTSQRAAIAIGGTIRGMAACEVIASAHPGYAVGTRMIAMSEWADFSVIRPDLAPVPVFMVPEGMDFAQAMGPLSLNSLTAYFGLLKVGRPRAGETVVVSGAAGSVGSTVCQIASITGCRVIGIAGGASKCARVMSVGKAEAAIDYRADDVRQRLRELCPNGIDIFFDNVGGDQLRAAVDCMAPHGRIIVCGQISTYDQGCASDTGLDMMKVVYGRLRIEGFVVGDYVDCADEARRQLDAWVRAGALEVAVDMRSGLGQLPRALIDLLGGANTGTVLVVND